MIEAQYRNADGTFTSGGDINEAWTDSFGPINKMLHKFVKYSNVPFGNMTTRASSAPGTYIIGKPHSDKDQKPL